MNIILSVVLGPDDVMVVSHQLHHSPVDGAVSTIGAVRLTGLTIQSTHSDALRRLATALNEAADSIDATDDGATWNQAVPA